MTSLSRLFTVFSLSAVSLAAQTGTTAGSYRPTSKASESTRTWAANSRLTPVSAMNRAVRSS